MRKAFATFLKADWRDLLFLSYKVQREVLEPFLPPGLEVDDFKGDSYFSLVAFRFMDTRFYGVSPPLFHSFAELNLRFYVRDEVSGLPGVVFIKEVCPYPPVAFTAKALFNERFLIASSNYKDIDSVLTYEFGGEIISAKMPKSLSLPEPGSLESLGYPY